VIVIESNRVSLSGCNATAIVTIKPVSFAFDAPPVQRQAQADCIL